MRRTQTLEERSTGVLEYWSIDAIPRKNGILEEWNIGFKNLNKILPPLLEHLAREKKSYMITSRPLSFDPAQDRLSPQGARRYGKRH